MNRSYFLSLRSFSKIFFHFLSYSFMRSKFWKSCSNVLARKIFLKPEELFFFALSGVILMKRNFVEQRLEILGQETNSSWNKRNVTMKK